MALENIPDVIKEFKFPQRKRPQQVRCIAYPNRRRRRFFTPKKVGDIVCDMLRSDGRHVEVGTNPASIRTELRKQLDRCFPCGADDDIKRAPMQEAIALAQAAILENATVIAVAISVLLALLILPRLLLALPPGILTLVPFAARAAIQQIPGIVARLEVQQAANASMFRRIVGL